MVQKCLLLGCGVAYLWRQACGQVGGGKAMAYPEVICCVVEEGVRCNVTAGCTTFDRRWLKNVSQRRQRYLADPEVSFPDRRLYVILCESCQLAKRS